MSLFNMVNPIANTLGRVMITIFQQTDLPTSHYYVFWGADSESELKNLDFEKILPLRAIWVFLKMHVK